MMSRRKQFRHRFDQFSESFGIMLSCEYRHFEDIGNFESHNRSLKKSLATINFRDKVLLDIANQKNSLAPRQSTNLHNLCFYNKSQTPHLSTNDSIQINPFLEAFDKFFISFSLIINITMIKFGELLQQSPDDLSRIVKANINNEILMPLISDGEFLKKIEIQLTSVEEAPFFIRHVFKIIRNPNERELNILKEFVSFTTEKTLVELTEILIESAKSDGVVSIEHFLKTIRRSLFGGENREIQVISRAFLQKKYEPIKQTILLLRDFHEENILDNQQYRAKLMKSIEEAFQVLSFSPVSIEDYLQIIGFLLKEKVTTQTSEFSLLVLLFKLSENYPKEIASIIQFLRKHINKDGIVHNYLSSAIFNAFSSHFCHELYYNTIYSSEFKLLIEISQKIYDLERQKTALSQMGWIGILAMNKWFKNENIEDSYHICLSLLREEYFYKHELISELLILVVSNILEQSQMEDLNNIEIILSALTARQIKYLILKLNQSFTEQKKKVIIFASIVQKLKIVQTLAVFFAHSVKFDQKQKEQYEEFTYNRQENWKSLLNQIDTSRYHTLEKEVSNLIQRNLFIINFQLDGMNAPSIDLSSQLRFYSNLLQNDEFSEGYWLNEQKIAMLLSFYGESLNEKIQILTDFIREKKLYNASAIMLITQLLRQLMKGSNNHIDASFTRLIDQFVKMAFEAIQREIFPSNILVYLEFILVILKLEFPISQIESVLHIFAQPNIKNLLKKKEYSKIHYFVELIVLTILQRVNHMQNADLHKESLIFYQEFACKDSSVYSKNEYVHKMCANYLKYGMLPTLTNFRLKEIVSQSNVKRMICHELEHTHIRSNIKKIGDIFKFESPLFKEEIVVLTFLSNSPQDNYYLRNHILPFLYQQYAKIFSLACEKVTDCEIHQLLFKIVIDLLQAVLVGDTSSHGESFYKTLNKIQLAYILLTKNNLNHLQCIQIRQIIKRCLHIIEKDNYPLLRQYIELILCRAYIVLNLKQPKNQMRSFFIDSMKVNINIGVPLVLTLGYELIDCCKHPQKYEQFRQQIMKIHEVLLKFISCHTAYLRAICQYYFYLYLQLVQPTDPFLVNIRRFWSEDKDSLKILKNVSMVVQGFRVGIEEQSDFLGFERVQEFPSNRVKLEIYASISKFYNEAVLNEIVKDQSMSTQYYDALCLAASERHEHLKAKYFEQFNYYLKYESQRTVKDNMKGKIKEEAEKAKEKVPKKNVDVKDKPKGKGKDKKKQIKQLQLGNVQDKHPINIFQKKYYELSKIKDFSSWSRINPNPKIIVIATLLQKVHNFGHILRTLHKNNAMIVVPSPQPLLHQQCKELVPNKCDVQIVEIRKKDLHKFIYLMKDLDYPMVALEQCSRSVMVQEAYFPDKFMLLLGNERIGAPASLLNEGDLLVEIPQIGKIRSLNVHVSMVLCLWQYLSQQK